MENQASLENYWTNRIYYAGELSVDIEMLIGPIKAFNDLGEELPHPLISVRVEELPDKGLIDYLLFGKIYPDLTEVQFGTIRAVTGRIELHYHIYQEWVYEYFNNFKRVILKCNENEKVFVPSRGPGRPPNLDNQEAENKLRAGENVDQVRAEWEEKRADELIDPDRAWNRIKEKAKKQKLQ